MLTLRLLSTCCFRKFCDKLLVDFSLCSLFVQGNNFKGMAQVSSAKPLNILVFTGEDVKYRPRYETILSSLKFCVNIDAYTIYYLTSKQVLGDPWFECTALLVLGSNKITEDSITNCFKRYVLKGGRILSCCSDLKNICYNLEEITDLKNETLCTLNYKDNLETLVLRGDKFYKSCKGKVLACDSNSNPAILKLEVFDNNNVIVTNVHLEVDPYLTLNMDEEVVEKLRRCNSQRLQILRDLLSEELELDCSVSSKICYTPCYMFMKDRSNIFSTVELVHSKIVHEAANVKNLKLEFLDFQKLTNILDVSDKNLPVLYNVSDTELCKIAFDVKRYFSVLGTKVLGHILFFVNVVGSTMNVINNFVACEGAVVVAHRQAVGRGRGSNAWISPEGSAAFSSYFTVPLNSHLGRRISIIQHMLALSVVLGVRKVPGYEDLPLRLKWPNDIYYGSSKIGGDIVNTTVRGKTIHVYTGTGVNVYNTLPTECINDVIRTFNTHSGLSLQPFAIEQVIGLSLNQLELLIRDFQANGPAHFMSLYHTYWLHSHQNIFIESVQKNATILGIDEYGFLLVLTDDGEKISLQPDGNSFDIMKNCIKVKV